MICSDAEVELGNKTMKVLGLSALEQRVKHDLSIIGYPLDEWVPEKFTKKVRGF